MHTNQFHGTYFIITLIFVLTSLGPNFMVPRPHNPQAQVHGQNLRCLLYGQQLKQRQDDQTYTQKGSLNSPFDL